MVNELPHLHLVSRVNREMEWPIDRKVLLSLAPDRAVLVLSTPTINEVREKLVIHIDPEDSGHWLNFKRMKKNKPIKDKTAKLTRPRSFSMNDMKQDSLPNILSVAQIRTPLGLSFVMNNAGWSALTNGRSNISSTETVSPRPLGPTHMLVIYSESPSPQGVYNLFVESPINDLVFAVNCPNLNIPTTTGQPFPHRHDDTRENLIHNFVLPKVLIRVKMPEVFVELVIYMHTRNQAQLFRNLLPTWMPDVLHPLHVSISAQVRLHSKSAHKNSKWLARMFPHLPHQHDKDVILPATHNKASESDAKLAVYDKVAHELAGRASFDGELERTKVVIDALKEMLIDVGLTDYAVEHEIEMVSQVLEKSIPIRARQSVSLQ